MSQNENNQNNNCAEKNKTPDTMNNITIEANTIQIGNGKCPKVPSSPDQRERNEK